MSGSEEVRFDVKGALGVITMTRPKALNSLTLDMIHLMDPQLKAWAEDDAVKAVAIHGEGEKSFCAGGDVRAVWEAGKKGETGKGLTADFFRHEYTLNRDIHRFPKPYVALINGITMGGGVGLSVHGSHRVAGERTMVAMPETGIGLFPDVGGTYVLPRLEGKLGFYMALTGARLKAADSLYAGFATHYVPREDEEIIEALAQADLSGDADGAVDEVLANMSGDPGEPPIRELRVGIDRCFDAATVEDIFAKLEAESDPDLKSWTEETLETLRTRSPTSMKVSLEALNRGAKLSFDSCMVMEYRLSQGCMRGHDFYEGIRALLVDKDKNPQWKPASLDEVSDEDVAAFFEEPEAGDLRLED
ncbi:MAG: enoyl-CoA hydratase/isomerase family protein [Rhodovibrionaceae bacterium]|nr:enoyl-CoA hydratase/isomerase family protein [Rhodovibrionaceae bacterium]